MSYSTGRKSPLRLINADKWKIAQYCIENKNIIQDTTIKGNPFTIWRVNAVHTAKEINAQSLTIGLPNINGAHVRTAIEFFNEIAILSNKMPEPPQFEDTVEMDRLKIEITKKDNLIKDFQKLISEQSSMINGFKNTLGKIVQLTRAEYFSTKSK